MGSETFSVTRLSTEVTNAFNESLIKYVQLFLVSCIDHKKILDARISKKRSANKIFTTSNGFDASDFSMLPTKADARKSLGVMPNEKILLFIGRFSGEEYGAKVLLEAFSILLREEPNAVLFLVGDKLPLSLQSFFNSLGIDKKTRIYGSIPHREIPKYIVASDVCIGPIMPTIAMPLKILEYMACGKPIVTGKGSVCVDLNPQLNFVESLPQPADLSQALLKVIRDPILAETLSSRVKELSGKLSWQNVAENLEALLKETAKIYSAR